MRLSARDTETALRLLAIQHSFAAIVLGEMFSPQVTTWLAEMVRNTSVVPLVLVYSREDSDKIPARAHVKAEEAPEALLKAVSAATSCKPAQVL